MIELYLTSRGEYRRHGLLYKIAETKDFVLLDRLYILTLDYVDNNNHYECMRSFEFWYKHQGFELPYIPTEAELRTFAEDLPKQYDIYGTEIDKKDVYFNIVQGFWKFMKRELEQPQTTENEKKK